MAKAKRKSMTKVTTTAKAKSSGKAVAKTKTSKTKSSVAKTSTSRANSKALTRPCRPTTSAIRRLNLVKKPRRLHLH